MSLKIKAPTLAVIFSLVGIMYVVDSVYVAGGLRRIRHHSASPFVPQVDLNFTLYYGPKNRNFLFRFPLFRTEVTPSDRGPGSALIRCFAASLPLSCQLCIPEGSKTLGLQGTNPIGLCPQNHVFFFFFPVALCNAPKPHAARAAFAQPV
jgi:hypothetical protein